MSYRASGLRAWIWQRIASVILVFFTLLIFGYGIRGGPVNYQDWRNTFSQTPIIIMVGLSFGALLAHVWVGMRDILIDYVAPPGLRHIFLSLLALWLLALGLWILLILARAFI